ncbi:protein phosphatase 2C domain-containing protein [Streptomyces sp. NBC_01387]|uniref:PP2C family protein-serine/threonine phosphatase n=1 Tax=unclassified Streptomyces TaxID=2593676 RepID=UPI0020241167|nr:MULTISPECIES: PP2C family serine/threonine-protein phosphatase [unclassified Streptomyces]MCX4549656.1 protein phosphatase 2C domain-containing protein [Streptomyces sp. NBC_01500]WSC21185.1 protein phosphatase 2C domain-containing protein [Streptomyces sp. NBC_01766]WSV55121.1 protein phosphatase 2C domain-containing protein [Streptomyces sp. NBC_01014]
MSLSLRFAAGSHKGMIREGNEDSGYAGPRLLAIADGMGGQAAGEVASSEVISTLVTLDDDVPGSDILTSLGTAVQRANDQLRMMVEEDPQLEGMGTTLTALLWTGQRLGLVHVGDSRAYLLRDGVLTQITQDHTWVQRLVDEGRITEEEATTHPQRSLLMRALGSGEHVEPDLSIREVRAGDRYMICSDGLSGVVSHQTMEDTLASYQGPAETIQELIQLALRGGGPDNITCIVADVLDVDSNDSLAQQLNDTPVVVGAVAENQAAQHDGGAMQTPAGRASGLGRQASPPPAPGGFGPPGSGDGYGAAPDGSFGSYSDEDFTKPSGGRKWLKRSLYTVLVLAVVGGGLYGGYRWTQNQYYVGSNNEHVALYQGISQDLAWISLSKVEKDHPEIELKYLPPYQRKQVDATITAGSLSQANRKITELADQANACKKDAERRKVEDENKTTSAPGTRTTHSATTVGSPKTKTVTPSPNAKPSDKPTPGPSLSEDEQKLVPLCGKQ